jgi:Helix-turn-helix domain
MGDARHWCGFVPAVDDQRSDRSAAIDSGGAHLQPVSDHESGRQEETPMSRRKMPERVTRVPDPSVQPTMSIEDAGRLLRISRTAAYNAAKAGDIPTIKIGGRKFVPTALLRELLGIDNPTKPSAGIE